MVRKRLHRKPGQEDCEGLRLTLLHTILARASPWRCSPAHVAWSRSAAAADVTAADVTGTRYLGPSTAQRAATRAAALVERLHTRRTALEVVVAAAVAMAVAGTAARQTSMPRWPFLAPGRCPQSARLQVGSHSCCEYQRLRQPLLRLLATLSLLGRSHILWWR